VPGKYVAGARKVCRGHHGARGRRVGQAWTNLSQYSHILFLKPLISCRSFGGGGGIMQSMFVLCLTRIWLNNSLKVL
jgi:hypothetical protein